MHLALCVIWLSSILSCSALQWWQSQPEELRTRSYDDEDWERFDDIEYDDQGIDDRVYGLDDECIMSTRDGSWKAKVDSVKIKKK